MPSFKVPNSIYLDIVNSDINQIKKISKIREINNNRLLKVLLKHDFWRPIQDYDFAGVPYILGMKCTSKSTAVKIQKKLSLVKCPIMMWPDMPIEIKLSSINTKNDIERVHKTIFFYVHEQIDIGRYEELITKALDER